MAIAKILHLSDFHFVADLTTSGRARRLNPLSFLQAKPHSYAKAVALAQALDRIQLNRGKFDIVLATGDLTTDGSEASFDTMLNFVQNDWFVDEDGRRSATRGLGATEQRRILLPGNHDRFTRSWAGIQTLSKAFENQLGTPTGYPYVVGYRRPELPNSPREPAILFFVFDSTPSAFAKLWVWQKTACGRLEAGDCDKMFHLALDAASKGKVESLNGDLIDINYQDCVRIAVLHHHPFDSNHTTLMENSDIFQENCVRSGINIVLFGHDHHAFVGTKFGYSQITNDNNHKVTFLCAPSATEYSSKNGFYTLEFGKNDVKCNMYQWDGIKRFVRGALYKDNWVPEISVRYPYH